MKALDPGVQVARGASILFTQNLAVLVIGLVYFVFLARLLPPYEMGVLTVLLLILYLIEMVGDLGLSNASSKYIPDLMGKGDIDGASSVYRKILGTNMLFGFSLSALCFIMAPWLSLALTQTLEYVVLFRVLSLSVLTGLISLAAFGFVQGIQHWREYAGISIVHFTIRRFLGLYLVFIGLGLIGIVYGWILGDILGIFLSLLVVDRRLKSTVSASFPLPKLLVFSIPVLGYNLLRYAVQWVDRVFVMGYMSLFDLGIYQIAIYALTVLGIIPLSIFTALYPQLSELYAKRGIQALDKIFKSVTRYTILIFTPIVFAVITLHRPIIALFAGLRYIEASIPLAIMCVGALAWGLALIINSFLMTLEQTKAVFGVMSTSFVLYLMASLLLVPNLGLIGAATVRGSLPFAMLFLGFYALRKHMTTEFDREACWKGFTASVIASVVIVLLKQATPSYVLLVAYGVIGAIAYVGMLVVLKSIHHYDVDFLENFAPKSTKQLVRYARKLVW